MNALELERILPSSLDAEMAVLGAMLLDPQEAAVQVRNDIKQDHFYFAAHLVIFRFICEMQDAGINIDMITLTQRLFDKGVLEEVGGAAYLTDLLSRVPTTANVDHYIDIVLKMWHRRQIIELAHHALSRGFEDAEIDAWLPALQQSFLDVRQLNSRQILPFKEHIKSAMEKIEKWFTNRGGVDGLPTGFRDIDRATRGLHPGNMIVIAGRPSMGKTALAMNIAEHNALTGNPVGVFSMEMSTDELTTRMLGSRGRVNLRAIQDGFGSDSVFPRLTSAASQLLKAEIHIDDTAALPIDIMRARARMMKLRFGIKLIVIDYLQLARCSATRRTESRQVEVSEVSAGTKAMAKELNLPVIALCQLNRSPDSREDGKPRLSDLRESGSLEQDADVVGLLMRPERYAETPQDKEQTKGVARLSIAKHRNGPTCDIDLTFLEEYVRFEDTSKVDAEDVINHRERTGEQ